MPSHTTFPQLQRIVSLRFCAGGFAREREECLHSFLAVAESGGFLLRRAVQNMWEGQRDAAQLCRHADAVSAAIIRFILLMVNDMEEKCPADTRDILPDVLDAVDRITQSASRDDSRAVFVGACSPTSSASSERRRLIFREGAKRKSLVCILVPAVPHTGQSLTCLSLAPMVKKRPNIWSTHRQTRCGAP